MFVVSKSTASGISPLIQSPNASLLICCSRSKHYYYYVIMLAVGVILPNLVWSPGRTAEATRTAAVACLCSTLQENPDEDKIPSEKGDGDNNEKNDVRLVTPSVFNFKKN